MNPRHSSFVQHYLSTGNATAAATAAGYSPHTAQEQGSRLLRRTDVADAVQQQQEQAQQQAQTTVQSLLAELEQARQGAIANGQCSAAVAATMAKAKLLGLDKPTPAADTNTHTIRVMLDDEELRERCTKALQEIREEY